jgi:hypothetical protein
MRQWLAKSGRLDLVLLGSNIAVMQRRLHQTSALRQSCRWHVAVDILLAVRRLVVQGGSTALEQPTKKPRFFC